MSLVAGVDFGTLSVRVSIVDSEKGRLGSGTAQYPLHRKAEDPDHATQSHEDHMVALAAAMRQALAQASVDGQDVAAMALDTTGSSVIPVDAQLRPLGDYYLWCDHRAWREAAEITARAAEQQLTWIDWSGGAYSSEWGFSKVLHWLRHNPDQRSSFATALEHCDMAAATLCGIDNLQDLPRSICAMGHKWMWVDALGGLPPDEFLTSVDPLLQGVREKLGGRYLRSNAIAGTLHPRWAQQLGLKAGIPIPVGALDAHWDAVGAGIRNGDVVNVVGTSTCIMATSDSPQLVPGVSGVVAGSIHPDKSGIEAGMSATGDMFDAIARRAGTPLADLSAQISGYRAGQTGLLRIPWDNGDRNVLANPELGGVTLGWKLTHTAADELFAALEGAALHTRLIFARMQQHGVPIRRVINTGGIPQRNELLNRIFANVLGKPVLVPAGDATSIGSAIFAFLAAGTFRSVDQAQSALCPAFRQVDPDPPQVARYDALSALFEQAYWALGPKAAPLGNVLPELRRMSSL